MNIKFLNIALTLILLTGSVMHGGWYRDSYYDYPVYGGYYDDPYGEYYYGHRPGVVGGTIEGAGRVVEDIGSAVGEFI